MGWHLFHNFLHSHHFLRKLFFPFYRHWECEHQPKLSLNYHKLKISEYRSVKFDMHKLLHTLIGIWKTASCSHTLPQFQLFHYNQTISPSIIFKHASNPQSLCLSLSLSFSLQKQHYFNQSKMQGKGHDLRCKANNNEFGRGGGGISVPDHVLKDQPVEETVSLLACMKDFLKSYCYKEFSIQTPNCRIQNKRGFGVHTVLIKALLYVSIGNSQVQRDFWSTANAPYWKVFKTVPRHILSIVSGVQNMNWIKRLSGLISYGFL